MKHMLRKTFLSCASIATALLMFTLAACGPSTGVVHGEGEHVFSEWEIVTPPECEKDGLERGTCACGYTTTRKIDAPGHSWDDGKTVREATCTEDGSATFTCTACGATKNDPIPALEHDWSTTSVIREATCEEPGLRAVKCNRCGTTKDDEPIPALDHDWEVLSVERAATCTEPGLNRVRCKRKECQKLDVMETPPTEHRFVSTNSVLQEPTCTTDGLEQLTCVKCQAVKEEPIPALNHERDIQYTVDVAATFDAPGSQSIHCTRCDQPIEGTSVAIPRLDPSVEADYEFRLTRLNGGKLNKSNVTVVVLGENGREVVRGTTAAGGVFRTKLYPASYTVRLENLPAGYTAQEAYPFPAGTTLCCLPLTGQLIDSAAPTGARYTVGSAMHDFSVTTIGGETVSLSGLLAEKKLVVINFWATWCGPCETEFPALGAVYQKYQDDVAVLAIDPASTGDDETDVRLYAASHSESMIFHVAWDDSLNLCGKFGTGYFPTTVYIDCEGVVCYVHAAMSTETEFETLFARYSSAPYWHETAAAALRTAN